MPSPILIRQELPEQAGQPTPTASPTGMRLVLSPQDLAGRRSELFHPGRACWQVVPGETGAARPHPEESLIADVRGSLTPAQIVEGKLLALLGHAGTSISLHRTDGRGALRRHRQGSGHPTFSALHETRGIDALLQEGPEALLNPGEESRLSWRRK
jgi:hypothetical protein